MRALKGELRVRDPIAHGPPFQGLGCKKHCLATQAVGLGCGSAALRAYPPATGHCFLRLEVVSLFPVLRKIETFDFVPLGDAQSDQHIHDLQDDERPDDRQNPGDYNRD